MPVLDRISLGKSGEDRACRELERRGYAVLARGYRTRFGEIDIVARDGPTLVFVEVKARTHDRYGGGAAAVTLHKQARMTAIAEDYLARHRLRDVPCRFDVVAIGFDRHGAMVVEVYRNAFDAVYGHSGVGP
jgi:putative endonuclease